MQIYIYIYKSHLINVEAVEGYDSVSELGLLSSCAPLLAEHDQDSFSVTTIPIP